MKQTSLICDRCGNVDVRLHEMSVKVRQQHLMEGELYLSKTGDVKQLCHQCKDDLDKFLDGEGL